MTAADEAGRGENVLEVKSDACRFNAHGAGQVDTLSIRAVARPCAELKGRIPCDLRDFNGYAARSCTVLWI